MLSLLLALKKYCALHLIVIVIGSLFQFDKKKKKKVNVNVTGKYRWQDS